MTTNRICDNGKELYTADALGRIRSGIVGIDRYVEKFDSLVGNGIGDFLAKREKICVLAVLTYAALC